MTLAELLLFTAAALPAASSIATSSQGSSKFARTAGHVRSTRAILLTRLSYLAPDIVTAILNGQQPTSLTREKLIRLGNLSIRWDEQRAVLGFG